MKPRISILLCMFIPYTVNADEQIERYKAAVRQKMLPSYQLSFTVTYPVYKPLPVYEKITKAYRINVNNGHRLSVVTKTINGKSMVSRKLVTPMSVTIHDDESTYVDKYTTNEGKGKYKEHDIDYIKLGKHPRTIGAVANNPEAEDYVEHFMKNKYMGKSVDANGVVTHTFQGEVCVLTLKFPKQSAVVPTYTSITTKCGKERKSLMIDAVNCDIPEGSQLPSRIEYTRRFDNVVQMRQVISDIKLEAVDSKLAFAERDLGINVNADVFVDNSFFKFWDGESVSDKPVTKSSTVLRINYFYLINGSVLALLGIMVLSMVLYRKRSLQRGLQSA